MKIRCFAHNCSIISCEPPTSTLMRSVILRRWGTGGTRTTFRGKVWILHHHTLYFSLFLNPSALLLPSFCSRIGRVTNPSLALINHSCDPNYRRVSHGTTTYGFASKPILRGHEITDIYCKPFSGSSIQERHRSLAKYNFTCECPACVNNWPTMDAMEGGFDRLPPRMYNQPINKVEAQVSWT